MLTQPETSDSRRGAILILTAFMLVSLLSLTALAIDIGYLCCVRTEAQATADAAAMAGAKGLAAGPAQVRTNCLTCAAMNRANGKPVILQNSDVQIGTWDGTNFTLLTGADETDGNACRVTVPLTAARNNSAPLFFAHVFGRQTQDVTASSFAGGQRWDVVIVQDITESYTTDLQYAVTGDQYALDSLNLYSPWSEFGIVQFTGWGSTVSPLRPIRGNYASLSAAISTIKITNYTYNGPLPWPNGGNGTQVGTMPPSSGTDLAAGLQQALLLFNAGTYNPPAGTRKAIILSTDGLPTPSSRGSHPNLTPAQQLTLAQQVADQAWAQGISVFGLLYKHDNENSPAAIQSLVRGDGTYVEVTIAPYLPAAMQSIITNSMMYSLLK